MKMTSKDWKAIKEYCEAYELRAQLSLPSAGIFIFTNKSGQEVKTGIQAIHEAVNKLKKEDTQA